MSPYYFMGVMLFLIGIPFAFQSIRYNNQNRFSDALYSLLLCAGFMIADFVMIYFGT